jgi:guanine nucleotide-binding protein G(i) subunit alpha
MGATASVLSFLERSPKFLTRDSLVKLVGPLSGTSFRGIENDVDRQLRKAKEDNKYRHKILLLGAGECGKSTVLKQIKALNKIALTKEELTQYIINIRRNCVEAIQTLLLVGGELGDELENEDLLGDVEKILRIDLADAADELTPELGHCISRMWKDAGVQEVYSKREFYHLMDSTEYVFCYAIVLLPSFLSCL